MKLTVCVSILLFFAGVPLLSGCFWKKQTYGRTSPAIHKAADFVLSDSNSGLWQDARAGINRQTVYVLKTSEVPDEVCDLVVQGLERVIRETGRTIEVAREESGDLPGYQAPEWYQNEAMTDREYLHGRQANAGKIVELLRSHDTSHDHFIVLITGSDLTSGEEGNNFIYGLSSYPYIIVSAKRFLDWKQIGKDGYSGEIYDEAVSLVAAHEFGHYLDLVQRNFNSWTNTGTLLDQHCKGENGDCLMQQSNVDAPGCHTALEQAQLIFNRENWLCPDCRLEVEYRKEALVDAGLAW